MCDLVTERCFRSTFTEVTLKLNRNSFNYFSSLRSRRVSLCCGPLKNAVFLGFRADFTAKNTGLENFSMNRFVQGS